MVGTRELKFTNGDFDCARSLVSLYTGIYMSDAKREMVYSRPTRQLRQLRLRDFTQYCAMLEGGAANELGEFINVITTNLAALRPCPSQSLPN